MSCAVSYKSSSRHDHPGMACCSGLLAWACQACSPLMYSQNLHVHSKPNACHRSAACQNTQPFVAWDAPMRCRSPRIARVAFSMPRWTLCS